MTLRAQLLRAIMRHVEATPGLPGHAELLRKNSEEMRRLTDSPRCWESAVLFDRRRASGIRYRDFVTIRKGAHD